MPLNRTVKPAVVTPRRVLRRANPSCRGGASSLLRLTQPGLGRLPNAIDLSGWIDRAAGVMLPVTGPHFELAASAR